jgi:peptide/nickel transport system substrate-binding protein
LIREFKLRQGVKFHDGSEVTAEDVVYSVQRLLGVNRAPAAPFKPILKPESVTAPEKYTVRFTLAKPFGPFFGMIPMLAIINPRIVKPHEENGDWAPNGRRRTRRAQAPTNWSPTATSRSKRPI